MTRSDFRPACESAGANRSGRVTHQSTLPRVRAAIPAVKSAAAAPSSAPFPPPATSCRVPHGSPPPGSRESTAARPKGNTVVARRCRPSIWRTWARKDSIADDGRTLGVDLSELAGHVPYLFYAPPPRVKVNADAYGRTASRLVGFSHGGAGVESGLWRSKRQVLEGGYRRRSATRGSVASPTELSFVVEDISDL